MTSQSLIDAAPALLEAAKAFVRMCEMSGWSIAPHSPAGKAKAAIADAETEPEAEGEIELIDFSDMGRAALLWVLWHHQGASSDVGQPIRFALGMGKHERMSDEQISKAEKWFSLSELPANMITQTTEDLAHELWAMAQGRSIEDSVKAMEERLTSAKVQTHD